MKSCQLLLSAKQTRGLNPIENGLFQGCSRMGEGAKGHPLLKICHAYDTIMQISTVIPYLKKIQKIYESRDTALRFSWHEHFLPEISNFCYIKNYRYRLFKLFWVFKDCFNKHGPNFDGFSKSGYSMPS